MRPLVASWPGLLAVGIAGCGPIQSTQVLVDADAELRAARHANARQEATYPYALAEAYLEAARTAQARAEYQTAVRYGERAAACAETALRVAAPGAARPAAATRRPGPACGPPYDVPDRETAPVPTSTTSTAASSAPRPTRRGEGAP